MPGKTYKVEFYCDVPEEWLREVEQYEWFHESKRIGDEKKEATARGEDPEKSLAYPVDRSYTLEHMLKIIRDGEGRPEIMRIRKLCSEMPELDSKSYFIDSLYSLYIERKYGTKNRFVALSILYLGFIAEGKYKDSSDPKLIEFIKQTSCVENPQVETEDD